MLAVACSRTVQSEPEEPSPYQPRAPDPAAMSAAPKQDTALEWAKTRAFAAEPTTTLDTVLQIVGEQLQDAKENVFPPSLSLLTIWGATHPWWPILDSGHLVTREQAMKDIVAARGKVLCTEGRVIEIYRVEGVEDLRGIDAFHGEILDTAGDVTSFVAVWSTAGIVAHTKALFCGVALTRMSYRNSGGGTTHGPRVLGVFMTPENTQGHWTAPKPAPVVGEVL